VRYFFQEPSVRSAVCAALDRASQRIAPLPATAGMTPLQTAWPPTPSCSATSPRWSSGPGTATPHRSRSTSRTDLGFRRTGRTEIPLGDLADR